MQNTNKTALLTVKTSVTLTAVSARQLSFCVMIASCTKISWRQKYGAKGGRPRGTNSLSRKNAKPAVKFTASRLKGLVSSLLDILRLCEDGAGQALLNKYLRPDCTARVLLRLANGPMVDCLWVCTSKVPYWKLELDHVGYPLRWRRLSSCFD